MSKSILRGLFLIVANLNLPQEGQTLAQTLNSLPTQIMFREGKCFRSSWIVSLQCHEALTPRRAGGGSRAGARRGDTNQLISRGRI